jgi:hypothetical protein
MARRTSPDRKSRQCRAAADAHHLHRAEAQEPGSAIRIVRAFGECHRCGKTECSPTEPEEEPWHRNKHARSAFGVGQIPLGACVEIETTVEIAV